MMRRIVVPFLGIALAIMGCSQPSGNGHEPRANELLSRRHALASPGDVVVELFRALSTRDEDAFRNCVTETFQAKIEKRLRARGLTWDDMLTQLQHDWALFAPEIASQGREVDLKHGVLYLRTEGPIKETLGFHVIREGAGWKISGW